MKKRIAAIFAGILAAVLILPVMSGSLFHPAAVMAAEEDDLEKELKEANTVIDLYEIAEYYGKDLQLQEGFEGLDLTAEPEILAQKAAEIILLGDKKIAPVAEAVEIGEKIGPSPLGVYLAIAHGSDLDEYVMTITDEEGNEKIVTIAQTDMYEYRFLPVLVSTSEENRDVVFELKPERISRLSDLRIIKNVPLYNDVSKATFVFSVIGTLKGEKVYDDVVGITFAGPGSDSVIVKDLPVGAEVVVTEIYKGAQYKLDTEEAVTVTIAVDPDREDDVIVNEVSFTDSYDRHERHGFGVINSFEHDGTQWNLTQS